MKVKYSESDLVIAPPPGVEEGVLVHRYPDGLVMFCQISPGKFKMISLTGNRLNESTYSRGDPIPDRYRVVSYAKVEFGTK